MTTQARTTTVLTLAVLAMVALAGSARAEITFDGFLSWMQTGTQTFDARGSDKLVVVVTGEHNFNQSANGQIYSVKYDGQPLIRAVDVNPKKISEGGHGDTATDIWYLDNPGSFYTTGTITASVEGNGLNYVYTAIGLSGTADGVGATAAAPGAFSVNLTTTAADSMVIFSIGMGGGGNTASPLPGVTANSPAGAITFTGLEAGSNWAGHAVARAVISSPSLQTFSFDTTKTDVATIAAEFRLGVPHNLTLRVDPVTGDTSIRGDATRNISINYYQVTSAAHSLDAVNWVSLADQDFEGSGPPNGTGDGWEEAGGAGTHALAEAYLLGNSTIGAGLSVSLGQGYDSYVGAEDLVFTYRTDAGKIVEGLVEYVTSVLPGDVDNDGDIDNADLGKAVGSFTGAGGSTAMRWRDGDMDGDGDVDNADLGLIAGAFTGAKSAGAESVAAGQATVPEPASMLMLAMAGLALLRRRS